MDPPKRRLVYVADDTDAILNELSGTPPRRSTRMSKVQVSPSFSGGSRGSTDSVKDSVASEVSHAMVLSYDGFLFADGSGRLAQPRDAQMAQHIARALKDCLHYLRQNNFLGEESSASDEGEDDDDSSASIDDASSSCTSVSTDRPQRGRKRAAAAQASGPTVMELRQRLRELGLSTLGPKKVLLERLQHATGLGGPTPTQGTTEGSESRSAGCSTPSHTLEPSPCTSRHSDTLTPQRGTLPRHSDAVMGSGRSSTELPQTASECSPEAGTRGSGLWGKIYTVGSRLFGGSKSSSPVHGWGPQEESPGLKRRRSS